MFRLTRSAPSSRRLALPELSMFHQIRFALSSRRLALPELSRFPHQSLAPPTRNDSAEMPGSQLEKARGALLGLACGDAVGTTVEFCPRDRFTPMTDMIGGGKFRLAPG